MIKTERTTIRPILKNDNEQVFAYRSDKDTNKYQGWIPESLEEVDNFIENNPTVINIPETWFQLVVIENSVNKVIGDIGIHFTGKENLQCEIGFTLSKNFQGRGYANESVGAVINYLFNELQKNRITASVDPDNLNSIALLERLGFRKEAHFKESLLINGKWVDDVVYAILKNE